jgi:hypothetical protein
MIVRTPEGLGQTSMIPSPASAPFVSKTARIRQLFSGCLARYAFCYPAAVHVARRTADTTASSNRLDYCPSIRLSKLPKPSMPWLSLLN